MKKQLLALTLALALCLGLAACGAPGTQRPEPADVTTSPDPNPDNTPADATGGSDKPTIPEDVAEGIEYLYDFTFTDRYDNRRTADFSLTLPETTQLRGDSHTLDLYEKYRSEASAVYTEVLDGDGMIPFMYKRYLYSFDTGEKLFLETDFYEPDDVEYISCLHTDIAGAATNRGVAVGSSEGELLSAYREDLYYIGKDKTERRIAGMEGESDFAFEYAYAWQPFTPETNEIRDITFYIQDGKVASVEVMRPFELRYVYGYDREAGLRTTEERRASLELSE